jgi:hypothetical protein
MRSTEPFTVGSRGYAVVRPHDTLSVNFATLATSAHRARDNLV